MVRDVLTTRRGAAWIACWVLAGAGCLPAWPAASEDASVTPGDDVPVVPCDTTGITLVSYFVRSDDNGDGDVNKGERVGLEVAVKNCESGAVRGLWARLAATDADITVDDYNDTTTFGDVPSGSTVTGSGKMYFRVSADAQPHAVAFTLQVTDGDGKAWDVPMSVPVVTTGAGLALASTQVTVDDNGDRQVNKGERIGLKVTVRNDGKSKALGVVATLTSTDADVTVDEYNNVTSVGDVAAGAEQMGSGTVYFRVADSAQPKNLPFRLQIQDQAGNTWKVDFTLPLVATGGAVQFVAAQVTVDDNGDKAVNRGERIGVKMTLKNAGTSKVLGVQGVLSCLDADVTVDDYNNATNFGDIAADEEMQGSSTVYFRVSKTAAPKDLAFRFAVTDQDQNTWSTPFTLPLVATGASLAFEAVQITNDEGNDHQADPGERVGVKVTLKNTGTSKALGVQGILDSNDGQITVDVYNNASNFGDIAAGQSALGSGTLYFRVSASSPAHAAPFHLAITDTSGNAWGADFTVPIR